jgi:hypothetical protein
LFDRSSQMESGGKLEGTRSRAEGDNRSAANTMQQQESRSGRRGIRGKLEECFGVVGPEPIGRQTLGLARHRIAGLERVADPSSPFAAKGDNPRSTADSIGLFGLVVVVFGEARQRNRTTCRRT